MTNIKIFSIAAMILAAINFIIILVQNRRRKLSFKNSFIFDYFSFRKTPIIYFIIFIFFLATLIGTFIFGLAIYKTILCYIAAAMFSLASLILFFMLFFKERTVKSNLIIHYLFFIFVSVSSLMVGVSGFFEHQVIGSPDLQMWLWICFIVLGSISFLSLLNPLLWKPTFLEKAEENGLTIYIRKSVIWVSVYFWANVIILLIEVVLLFISSFFMGVQNPIF